MKFSESAEKRFAEIVARYPTKLAALIPSLHLAQTENKGWISPEVEQYVVERLNLPLTQVREATTFYTMFNKKPVGRWHLQVCGTLSCSLLGADRVFELLEKKLGIKAGETTPDGKFTLSRVECLGSCGTAPVIVVNNDEYIENITCERVEQILDELK
jgi:NADH-quinone oxidoreductase subunit E